MLLKQSCCNFPISFDLYLLSIRILSFGLMRQNLHHPKDPLAQKEKLSLKIIGEWFWTFFHDQQFYHTGFYSMSFSRCYKHQDGCHHISAFGFDLSYVLYAALTADLSHSQWDICSKS
jgi:hypothetical protein